MTDYYTCPECNGHRRYCGCKEKAKAKEMTDKQTPPDWVLIEAAKRSFMDDAHPRQLQDCYTAGRVMIDGGYWGAFKALCDMIERYEQPPVDRKLLCAREAVRLEAISKSPSIDQAAFRAIELWEEGFGK